MKNSKYLKPTFLKSFVWVIRRLFNITPEKLNTKFHKKNRSKLIKDYFNKHDVKKLQIGCQSQELNEWLNVDLLPKSRNVVMMDATKEFPFPNDSFDYIFSEHMIEHIDFAEANFMLKECYRVLKNKGKIRIATPNLKFLIDLYSQDKSEIHVKYLSFSSKYLSEDTPVFSSTVINNFFRDWGHKFIHDKESLFHLLDVNGFKNIETKSVGKSNDPAFRKIEKHGNEIGEDFNILETIIVEAEK